MSDGGSYSRSSCFFIWTGKKVQRWRRKISGGENCSRSCGFSINSLVGTENANAGCISNSQTDGKPAAPIKSRKAQF